LFAEEGWGCWWALKRKNEVDTRAVLKATTSEWIFAAFVALTVIHLFVPSARSGIVSIYDAGMFAIYLIVLAWAISS